MAARHHKEKSHPNEYLFKGYDMCYGSWLTAGGMHPGRTGLKYLWIPFCVLSPMFMVILVITCLQALSQEKKDLGLASEIIHFVVFLVIELTIILSFSFQTSKVDFIYRTVGQDFYDYLGTMDKKTCLEIRKLSLESERKIRILARIFIWMFIGAYVTAVYLRPVFKYYQEEHLTGTPDDGMHSLLIVTLWLPFNKYNFWSNFVFYILEFFVGTWSLPLCLSHNLFVLSVCEKLCISLRMLGLGLRRLNERVAALPDLPRREALRICLRHSIRHHQLIIRMVKDYEDIIFYPALVFVGSGGVLLCMCFFLFMSDEVSIIAKVVFLFFLISELIAAFIYCSCGEKIKTFSGEIHEEIFAADWINDSATLKSYIIIVTVRARKGLIVSAGGFMSLSHETFGNMLSSAFSYFNLMIAASK
uniref:Odorant receptor n=1 Tax=Yemma signatus TaxID=300820 RepID=A0A385H513_9HEMI|nr:odorant receptor [Yemma signatus]